MAWFAALETANVLTSKRQVGDIVKPELLNLLLNQGRYDDASRILDRWIARIDFEIDREKKERS